MYVDDYVKKLDTLEISELNNETEKKRGDEREGVNKLSVKGITLA